MQLKPILFAFIMAGYCSCQKTDALPPSTTINSKQTNDHQLTNYVCYKTDQAINLDGLLNEDIWQQTPPSADFQDIEGGLKPPPPLQTYVKMLWDNEYLYFGAYLKSSHIWANMSERDDPLYKENAFEIFLDPDGDTHNYCELEINAKNTVWDLMMLRPYREDNLPKVKSDWNIQGLQTAVHLDGTINDPADTDSYWTVEVAIPWKGILEIIPLDYLPEEGVQWRINFARVHWTMDVLDNRYHKRKGPNNKNLPAAYSVWSPQLEINMHMPERWGYVQFSETIAGQGSIDFIPSPEEELKMALRELYYQQNDYHRQYHQYATELDSLTLPIVNLEDYDFRPELSATAQQYSIISKSVSNNGYWCISNDGKIRQYSERK